MVVVADGSRVAMMALDKRASLKFESLINPNRLRGERMQTSQFCDGAVRNLFVWHSAVAINKKLRETELEMETITGKSN